MSDAITISSVTSLLSAAAGPAGAVTGVSNLLTEFLKIVAPDLADSRLHAYDQQATDRLNDLISILAQADGPARADKLNRFFSQLCIDAGSPAVGLGADLSVPVAFVVALANCAVKLIRDEAVLTTLTQTAAGEKSSAPAQ